MPSPKLVFGFEPKLPKYFLEPYIDDQDLLTFRINELENLGNLRSAAIKRVKFAALRAKIQYDKNVYIKDYEIGDYIFI